MFILKSKYDEKVKELLKKLSEAISVGERYSYAYEELYEKYLNLKFGQKPKPPAQVNQFTQAEIRSLIRLCHPDRHNNSEASTRMTQKLLSLKE